MKNLVIIGGGFAGLWAAFSAVRKAKALNIEGDVKITLINKDAYHGLRPRFYETNLDKTRILLKSFLAPIGVSLLVDEVIQINSQAQTISLKVSGNISYDQLIIAAGSKLSTPNILGLWDYSFNVDTFDAAVKLQQHIYSLPKATSSPGQFTIIVGGDGFTGVEVATDIMDRLINITPKTKKPRVIIIDRSKVAGRFSAAAQEIIFNAFHDMGIETISDIEIQEVFQDKIKLSNSTIIPTNTLVWTAGMHSNELTKQLNIELDQFGRLPVDRYLRVKGVGNCFAAGDVAAATTDGKHMALLSCQHAMPQGRFAGNNAIANLFNDELLMYEQHKYVTSLDLGSWGALYTEGWDQEIVSIQDEAKKIKLFINHERIYPPKIEDKGIDDLLKAAEPAFKPIKL